MDSSTALMHSPMAAAETPSIRPVRAPQITDRTSIPTHIYVITKIRPSLEDKYVKSVNCIPFSHLFT